MTLEKVLNVKAERVRLSRLGNTRHYLTPYKRAYTRIKKRNMKLGFDNLMTYADAAKIAEIPNCHYCNVALNRLKHGKGSQVSLMDRKDNNKGYEKDNVVPCCWRCNNGRGNLFSYEEWYGMTGYLRKPK